MQELENNSRYHKTSFYIIKCKNQDVKECYVGHTVNGLSKRVMNHKSACKTYPNRRLYKFINENGGFDNSFLWSIDCSIRSLINSLYHKCMVTWEVWTQGYVKYYQSTVMSEQQALNYAETINQSIEDLRKFKQTINNNSNDKIDTDANDGC